ncbi:MAG: acetolactate synthase large subunit, partial [Bacteroidales bacterium]|nr:acetolactate synthase large subunit [Bacteroidales bacterium]
QVPVKIVVLNNNFLGMVRQWQDMFFNKRYASTELVNPDFIKISEAYGIPGRLVDTRADLRERVAEMLSASGPFVLEVAISREANVLPMVEPGSSVSEVRLTY